MVENTRIFDIEKLLDNPYARVMITGLAGSNKNLFDFKEFYNTKRGKYENTLVSYLTSPIDFGGANTYDSPAEEVSGQSFFQSVIAKTQFVIGKTSGKSMANYSLKSFEQSASTWTGSATPEFTFKLAFIAVREADNVTEPVKAILQAFYPTPFVTKLGTVMRAPLGYGLATVGGKPFGKLIPRASLAVQVGKWFRATRLIPVKADFSFSKECLKSGKPVYAEGSVVLRPFRTPSWEEVKSYFIDDSVYVDDPNE